MQAILVCVDYADMLEITLPRNRHHFTEVVVVTSKDDDRTKTIARRADCHWIATDAFYRDGAMFNKWLALEEGLGYMRRTTLCDDWLAVMDADIVWPKDISSTEYIPGKLYTPYRRMMGEVNLELVDEEVNWYVYPQHRQEREWAGYSQIFHTSDPVLGPLPWHQTNWRHAGGADSFFQAKWSVENKVRPDWSCLHLGPAGVNWGGRTSPYLDGTKPEGWMERHEELRRLVGQRREAKGPDRFAAEKIEPK